MFYKHLIILSVWNIFGGGGVLWITAANQYESNVFLNGAYQSGLNERNGEDQESSHNGYGLALTSLLNKRATPFVGDMYLPTLLECRGRNQQCVPKAQCRGGYYTEPLSQPVQSCVPEENVCCTYKPPTTTITTTTTTTTTQIPFAICPTNTACVSTRDCRNGEILSQTVVNLQTQKCYQPKICCNLPSTMLTEDGYILKTPPNPFVYPSATPYKPTASSGSTAPVNNQYLPSLGPSSTAATSGRQPKPTQQQQPQTPYRQPSSSPTQQQPQTPFRQPTQQQQPQTPYKQPSPSPTQQQPQTPFRQPTQQQQPQTPYRQPSPLPTQQQQPQTPYRQPSPLPTQQQPQTPFMQPLPSPPPTQPQTPFRQPTQQQQQQPQTPYRQPSPLPTQQQQPQTPYSQPLPTQQQQQQPQTPFKQPTPATQPSGPHIGDESLTPGTGKNIDTQLQQQQHPFHPAQSSTSIAQTPSRQFPSRVPTLSTPAYLPPRPNVYTTRRQQPQPHINEIPRHEQKMILRGEDQLSPQIFPKQRERFDNGLPDFSAPAAPPVTCASALVCTAENYCSSIGVISETPVELSSFRVPLTDCIIESSGAPGKCCRDPNYVDPWPVNLAGVCAQRNKNTKPQGIKEFDANFAEIPWQAMILKESTKTLLCGGAIIGDGVVLTTASCVQGVPVNDVRIKAGEWELGSTNEPLPFQLTGAKAIEIHPSYDANSGSNDMAVIHLTDRLQFASHIQPLCINDKDPSPSETCITTGWGQQALSIHEEGAIMHITTAKAVSRSDCNADETGVCVATNFDSCQFDAGSALACGTGSNVQLKGIYSVANGCGEGQVVRFIKPDVAWVNKQFLERSKPLLLQQQA